MTENNISLRPFNTFGIDVKARQFARFQSLDTLQAALAAAEGTPHYILGGGSNILFTKNYDGLVLKNEIGGIEKIKEDEQHVWLKVGAGENWHQFVLYCIANHWAGVENLSLIPGCVGASPMQNIGAYGVEIESVFEELQAYHWQDKALVNFSKTDCEFGYRESVFKRKMKGSFVILNVTYKLSKNPVFNISYGAIEEQLQQMQVKELSIKAISDAVMAIRRSKLPDPAETGNAGSFFKNPTIPAEHYAQLKDRYPTIPGYENKTQQMVKVPAGWLIEQAGWKGYRQGDAGVHPRQALVLVNYGQASGQEIFDLSTKVMKSIQEKFEIELEREVNIM